MTKREVTVDEVVDKICASCGVTEDEARDAIYDIERAYIQEEKEKIKNFNPKKVGEAMARFIAILEEDKKS